MSAWLAYVLNFFVSKSRRREAYDEVDSNSVSADPKRAETGANDLSDVKSFDRRARYPAGLCRPEEEPLIFIGLACLAVAEQVSHNTEI